MKQTQKTRHEHRPRTPTTLSLAGEEAVAYSLARGKAAAVTRESGGVLSGAREKATLVTCT